MKTKVYYNEIDAYCASWLRSLIAEKLLPFGDVDERDIRDVTPSDLAGYTQCHFFAGIGGWAHALNLAGWPEDRPVWTGSCPCQPFSSAGRRAGTADERHLWPHWFHLIEQCKPPIVFGEQVASKDGLGWLDLVQADLEAAGYASAATDMCAAGIGAPHIRQRLWFVGLADTNDRTGRPGSDTKEAQRSQGHSEPSRGGATSGVGDCLSKGLERHAWDGDDSDQPGWVSEEQNRPVAETGSDGGLADADSSRFKSGQRDNTSSRYRDTSPAKSDDGLLADGSRPSPTNGFWGDADWLFCRDGKWRPVEPGTFPLAHGVPARVGRLRAYGNAIVPQVAAEVVKIFTEGEHP